MGRLLEGEHGDGRGGHCRDGDITGMGARGWRRGHCGDGDTLMRSRGRDGDIVRIGDGNTVGKGTRG